MNQLTSVNESNVELSNEEVCRLANIVAKELIRLFQDNKDMRIANKPTNAYGKEKAIQLKTTIQGLIASELPSFNPEKLFVSIMRPCACDCGKSPIGISASYEAGSYENSLSISLSQSKKGENSMHLESTGSLSNVLRFTALDPATYRSEFESDNIDIDFSTQINVDGLQILRPRTETDLIDEENARKRHEQQKIAEAERQRRIQNGELRPDTISEPLVSVIGRWVAEKYKNVFGAKK